jgi:hypothetical protein
MHFASVCLLMALGVLYVEAGKGTAKIYGNFVCSLVRKPTSTVSIQNFDID